MPAKLLSLSLFLVCAAALFAGEEKPDVELDIARIGKLVEQLASDDFDVREKATKDLSKLEEVPQVLRDAAQSADPEVSRRARAVSDLIVARAERNRLSVRVQWAQTNDFHANSPHNPLVVRDRVVVGTDLGQLRAYRCQDGKSLWVHEHGARIFHRPESDGQRIYFSSERGVTAVNVDDGTEVWNFAVACCGGPVHVPAGRGTVVVGGHDGNLYAVDAKSGQQIWTSDFIADAPPDPLGFSGEVARMENTEARPTSLASDGEIIFLSVFDQCRVVAVNVDSGKRLWSFRTKGWLFGSAVATDDHVFVGSQDKSFYCLDKQTGHKIWSRETKGRIESGGVVDDTFVYFASCDGGVYCLNQSDGQQRWRFAADRHDDGRNSAIYSVPLLHDGGVYFGAGEGQAYAVNLQSGEFLWKVRPSKDSEMYSSPASDGKLFFVVTRSGINDQGQPSLVAIRLP